MQKWWTHWFGETRVDRDSERCRQSPSSWDRWLLGTVLSMVGFGLVMLYSASAVQAHGDLGNHLALVRSQAMRIGIGVVVMIVAMNIDYRWYRRGVYPILGATILLLGLVLVPGIGIVENGARRWFQLGGVSVQPAEIAKVSAVMFLAYSISKKGQEKMKQFTFGFVPHLMVIGLLVLLLMGQPDFGTSLVLLTMMGIMLFVSGARVLYLSGLTVLGAGAVSYLIVSSQYRMERIWAYLDPWRYRQGIGYQISESLIAIGSGGLTGKGLGNGSGKLGYVPELGTDFIGTLVAEELGFLGMMAVVGLFGLFVWRGFRIAYAARDDFGRYLAFGLTVLIALQATINLCVVTGLLPTKGMTLPFFSLGGSSMVMSLFAVGVLLNISRGDPDWWALRREERNRRHRRSSTSHEAMS